MLAVPNPVRGVSAGHEFCSSDTHHVVVEMATTGSTLLHDTGRV